MAIKDKVLRQLATILLLRDKPAGVSQPVTGAAAAGQKVVPCAATAGIVASDMVRVGSGELLEEGIVASVQANVSYTLADNLTYAHAAGEVVVQRTAYDLGDITSDGFSLSGNAQTQDVPSAMRRLAYSILNGYIDLGATFALPTVTNENLAIALGMPFTDVKGAGTAAAPWSLITDGNSMSGEQNQSLMALGVTMDGVPLRVELWNAEFDYSGLSFSMTRGALTSVPVKVMSSGMLITTNASAYVTTTTKKPTKGKVYEAPVEVGVFADATVGPLATTTTALAAAGATVLALTAATNLVAGDWLRVSTSEGVEFHRIESIAALNVTIKTALLRAQAAGTSVVREVLVPFGSLGTSGAKFEMSGSVEAIRSALTRAPVGMKPGSAVIRSVLPLIEFSLAHFARALGIPQAQIVAGRLSAIGSAIASDVVQGVYTRGILQDGTSHWTNYWGCSADVSAFVAQLTNMGVPEIPFVVKPSSGVHFIQHP